MNHIVIDLETTGIDILSDEPTQIALIAYSEGKSIRYSSLIKTNLPLDPVVQRLTGITPARLAAEGVSPELVAKRYNDMVWNFKPVTLLGYNIVNFDLPILQRMLARYTPGKFKHPPVERVEDVMHLASRHFKTNKWLRLEEVARRLDLEPEGQLHDAMTDVELTWRVYSEITTQEAIKWSQTRG